MLTAGTTLQVGSDQITLADNDVHLWCAYDETISEPYLIEHYFGVLDHDELTQQQKFIHAHHRHQYLVTRALVRFVLSLYEPAIAPEQWQFSKNDHGKPAIANPNIRLDIQFNVSHAEQLIVLAVQRSHILGVDTEWLHRQGHFLDLASHYFSQQEVKELFALPAALQNRRFFELWTLKEAYIKARGEGLAIPLDQFSFVFKKHSRIALQLHAGIGDDNIHWSLWQGELDSNHLLGLTTSGREPPPNVLIYNVIPGSTTTITQTLTANDIKTNF